MRLTPLLLVAAGALACARTELGGAGGDGGSSCLAQVTAVYDTVPLVRRVDGTVWVAADRARFTELVGPAGHFHATDIAASGSTAYGTAIGCAIVDGGVWCFPLAGPLLDSTDLGAGLGPGVMTDAAVEVVTSGDASAAPLTGARQLSATMNGGGAAFCAVADAGGIWCWGYGVKGILGRGDTADSAFARPVLAGPSGPPFADAAEVRLGFDSACARKSDGSVWCWGGNALGQTGIADSMGIDPADWPSATTPFPSGPLFLSGPAVRLAASPGNTHCAILKSGEIMCWGWNAYAQAGAGGGATFVTPTPVVTSDARFPLTDVVDLAPDRGMQAMCATKSNGALVCWGHPFAPAGQPDATSPYPIAIPLAGSPGSPLRLPLSSYGGRDGALVYVDPNGKLTFDAGGFPFAAQPPCD